MSENAGYCVKILGLAFQHFFKIFHNLFFNRGPMVLVLVNLIVLLEYMPAGGIPQLQMLYCQ